MRTIKIFFFLLTFVASFGVGASQCPVTHPSLKIVFESSSFAYPCEFLESLEGVMSLEQGLHGKTPQEKMALVLNPEGSNARFDYGTIIETPYRLFFSDPYGRRYDVNSPNASVIFGHEYGHFLFKGFFLEAFPQFEKLFKKFNLISDLKVLLLTSREGRSKRILETKIAKLQEELGESSEFQLYNAITASYSELYADLLSALVAQNKNAMTKALYYDAMSDFEYAYIRTRSFDSSFTEDDERYMSDSHGFFAYARFHIGQNLWPQTNEEAQLLLQKIQKAFIQSMKKDFLRKELLDIKSQNDQLISLL